MCVPNFRSVGPAVQPAEYKQTDRHTDRQTLPEILPLLLTREVKRVFTKESKLYHILKHPSNRRRIGINRAWQINRINWINNPNRINNGSIDLCKSGGRSIGSMPINKDQYRSLPIDTDQ